MSALTLTNVSYKYKNARKNAVSDISCKFEEGKSSAEINGMPERSWRYSPCGNDQGLVP